MKFRGEARKNLINWVLILATMLAGTGSQIPVQAQVSPDGDNPASESEIIIGGSSWKKAVKILTIPQAHLTGIDALVFSTDGEILFSGGSENDGALKAWSVSEGEKMEDVRAQQADVSTLAVTPNGKMLISSGTDAIINLYDLRSKDERDGEAFPDLEQGPHPSSFIEHGRQVLSVAISPDGNTMVSGGLDGIRVWSLVPRRPVYQLAGLGNPVYSVSFNPNGYIIASGDDRGRVQFWNVREGKYISEFLPHNEAITGLTFTSDGKLLITASNDRTAKVWDLDTGELIQTLEGHTGKIRAIALNPDGRTLATASNDGIRIWNIETGEILGQLQAHRDWVTSLAFSRDGRLLASGGLDSSINIWENTSIRKTESEESEAQDEPEETEESEDSEETEESQ
ncbi:MAG: WD40 repeat domain-containing protein [Hydrococcus sp. RU_2_2]|nr:WD40 repeat domain-containing protein [Hydrococcus sp. RU_2_2]NJP20510.1 WD40 repeat domain-containing protein [Hydrococcus sp. CRU_1_1]